VERCGPVEAAPEVPPAFAEAMDDDLGVPQGLAATYTCSGITAFSALKKTRERLGADDHLVIIGAGGSASQPAGGGLPRPRFF